MVREGLDGGAADFSPVDGRISLSELLQYAVNRVPFLYEDIRNNQFLVQGRGLRSFRPSISGESAKPQRPALFDFRRDDTEIYLPVTHEME